ncbi:MAG: hypothetical protein LBT56_02140 [Prevotellaceae bacterium]|jgi:hypothetical protein|nr:hypothetical protein [Prevotellaceae bacterium]
MSNDKLKELFHSKLYNHETEVRQSDWDIISEQLNKKRRRKIIPLFYFYGTTGIVAALLIIMFLLKPDTSDTNDNIIAKTNDNTQTIKTDENIETTKDNQNQIVAENDNTIIGNQKTQISKNTNPNTNFNTNTNTTSDKNNADSDLHQHKNISNNNITDEKNDKLQTNTSPEKPETSNIDDKQKTEQPANNKNTKPLNTNDEWWNQPDTENQKEKNSHKLTLAFESGQNIGSSSVTSDFINNSWTKQSSAANDMKDSFLAATPVDYGQKSLAATQYLSGDKTNLKHKRPMNFGIRIKKNIGERIKLKTGLSYSYFVSEHSDDALKQQQQIHYVGIPLGAEFLLWRKNKFNIYLSGEFIAEKGVAYKYKESGITKDLQKIQNTESGSVRGLQFSANAGLGLSFNFTKNIGIYAEPNAVYYLKDNRQPMSFRTEKPFNIGLNIGLKYDL